MDTFMQNYLSLSSQVGTKTVLASALAGTSRAARAHTDGLCLLICSVCMYLLYVTFI